MTKMTKAVAAAVLAMGASAAQAGITIPAGDWTIDIGGNVNAYYTNFDKQIDQKINGVKTANVVDPDNSNTIGTGLLPSALGIGGKTRQNDLDIAFQFTFFTGSSSGNGGLLGTTQPGGAQGSALSGNTLNIRQAFMTFGDKSWGTIKAGRDLGIFGSDAILSDMTLLGVGLGAPGGSSTLGRIGNGYVYADWKGQISYASPNWNGFSFNVGVMEGWNNGKAGHDNTNLAYEGKASYEWGGDISGKVWLSGISQKHDGETGTTVLNGVPVRTAANTFDNYTSRGWDIGGKVNVASFGLVGYYYDGKGLDSAWQDPGVGLPGLQFLAGNRTDDSGGYVQATWTAPFGTKFGVSWGVSNSDGDKSINGANVAYANVDTESWIVGAYHPLTKSLNLVAEYLDGSVDSHAVNAARTTTINTQTDVRQISLGAILFF